MEMLYTQKEQTLLFNGLLFALKGEKEGHETTFLDWQLLSDGPPESFPYY